LPLRSIVPLVLIAASLAALSASGAAARTEVVGPVIVHRGQPVKVSVRTPSLAACLAEARYSDGSRQSSGIKRAHDGLVTWTVRVPNNAALGKARWSVRCGVTWQRTGTWLVKPATATKVDSTPHLLVEKQGFSQRNDKLGTGSTISYGLLLKNTSNTQDATETYLLINFAIAGGELVGTVTKKVDLVAAAGNYAFGDSLHLRTQAPVSNLEVTIKVLAHEPGKPRILPHFVNVRILPSTTDSGWIGEVDGEIVNDTSPQTLAVAKLSIVLLDATGRIVGGGNTTTFSPLPSGSRMVFLARSGFTAVPASNATSYIISVDPTYSAD
jgi:hypothetical protein